MSTTPAALHCGQVLLCSGKGTTHCKCPVPPVPLAPLGLTGQRREAMSESVEVETTSLSLE